MKGNDRRRGATLVEAMITVVIIGIVVVVLSESRLASPQSPGGQALRLEQATALLVEAQQEVLATPFAELATEADGAPSPAGRRVERLGPGLLRVTLEASWGRAGAAERRVVTLVTLRGDGR